MLARRFQPFFYQENFKGVNAKDGPENILDGEWGEDSLDIFSDPQGALASRPGFTGITSASIGASVAWCGFYEFDTLSGGVTTQHYIGAGSNGKLYEFISNGFTEIYSGLTTGANNRYSFFGFNNTLIIMNGVNDMLAWTGSGSCATFATSVTSDFGIEWQRYGWAHSTVDPRLVYYCTTLGDPDSAYTSFLNFDDDANIVTGLCKAGDDMIVGKKEALYRIQYRGTTPLFVKYRIPSKVGPVNHFTMKELPDGKVIFLAPDFNFYMLNGDNVDPCGANIQKIIKNGVNSRITKTVSGLLLNRNQYWCSFSYVSGATTNDRTLVMDWSRPYADKWGKIQYPWFIYTIGANCFSEVSVSGKPLLYHGGYTGKMYKDDIGTNDDGVAFSPTYSSKIISHGDPSLEKKYQNLILSHDASGDWDLKIQMILDGNAATEKNISQNLSNGVGAGALFDQAYFDEDYFASESDSDVSRQIDRIGKTIQIRFGTSGLDEFWKVYFFGIHVRGLRRGVRNREAA
jgi:hypothetical protein